MSPSIMYSSSAQVSKRLVTCLECINEIITKFNALKQEVKGKHEEVRDNQGDTESVVKGI